MQNNFEQCCSIKRAANILTDKITIYIKGENMTKTYIADLPKEGRVEETFMAKQIDVKVAKNGKQYLNIFLGDKTGEIVGMKWELSEEELEKFGRAKPGEIYSVNGTVKEWNGKLQLNITKIESIPDTMIIDMNDFVKASPENPEDMYKYIINCMDTFSDDELKNLCKKIWQERKDKLMYYPAATKNHHAEMGGLLYHTKTMAMAAEALCNVYKKLNRDLLLTGVFLHDIEKLTEIDSNEYGVADKYSFEGQMLGHIVQGIILLEKEMTALSIGHEKKIMIEHMILSHHYEPEFGSPKKPLFPEAEMLHYLDLVDARMYDMYDALKTTEEGEFSEKVWTLENRKLYKVTKEGKCND